MEQNPDDKFVIYSQWTSECRRLPSLGEGHPRTPRERALTRDALFLQRCSTSSPTSCGARRSRTSASLSDALPPCPLARLLTIPPLRRLSRSLYDGRMNRKEREETISAFNLRKNPNVLLISLKCGGVVRAVPLARLGSLRSVSRQLSRQEVLGR